MSNRRTWSGIDDPELAPDEAPTTIIPRITDDQLRDEPPYRAQPARHGARPRRHAVPARPSSTKRGRGPFIAIAAVVVLLLGVAVVIAANKYFDKPEIAADYPGPGGAKTIIEVKPGDDAEQMSTTMASKDVVASASAFFEAAVKDEGMKKVQPGFYAIPTKVPATQAVAALLDPASRVGNVVLSEGRQLHDTRDVGTGAVKEGIYTKIAKASCLDVSQSSCVTYDQLNAAGAGSDLAALGVPDWARDAVRSVPDHDRQLEGLIAAGNWNFDPTAQPVDILRRLVTESVSSYEQTGILDAGKQVGLSPYEMLVAASLVERESLPQDFPKVARVILNRLQVQQPLQFDSTVNYSLDETEVATTDADRARQTPWNTYAMPGLPATPISSPSLDALKAVENPEPGNWLYFVTIDKQGTTLFTNDYNEHLRNIERAKESGILDSGRPG